MPRHPDTLEDDDFYKVFKRETSKEIDDDIKNKIDDIGFEFQGDDFKRKLVTFSNCMSEVGNVGVKEYVNAVWFCALYAQGMSQSDAYTRVFPERVAKKSKGTSTISNSANSYFHSMLVQSVWKQVNIADHMLFIDKRFKAYNALESVLDDKNASTKNKIEAAGKLANLLQAPKEAMVRVDMNVQSKEIKSLEDKLGQLAQMQLLQIQNGDIRSQDIVEAELCDKEETEDDATFNPDIHDVEVYEKYQIIVRRK